MSEECFHYDTQAEINDIAINKCWDIRRALVVVIILLHALITINFGANWSYTHSGFIENGQSFWTVYLDLDSTKATYYESFITGSISTIVTDLYMVCAIPLGIIHTNSPSFQL